jgi:hypothetical protein
MLGVAALGTVLVARDLGQAPEELLSSHLPARIVWPPGIDAAPLLLAVGIAGALACLSALVRPGGGPRARAALARVRRLEPLALLAAGGCLALTLAHHLVPTLSLHLSGKQLVDRYHRHRDPASVLAVLPATAAEVGAFDRTPTLAVGDVPALARAFQERPELFALVPRSESGNDPGLVQPGRRRAVRRRRQLLAPAAARRPPTARAGGQNPLREVLWRPGAAGGQPDWPPPLQPVQATFADAIQLLGGDLPATIRRPARVRLTLHFRVTARPPAGYSLFVHLEGPGAFLNGDHPPMQAMFPTAVATGGPPARPPSDRGAAGDRPGRPLRGPCGLLAGGRHHPAAARHRWPERRPGSGPGGKHRGEVNRP